MYMASSRYPVKHKVRLVARIRAFTDQELASSDAVSLINVHSSADDKVAISFNDQSRKYEFDGCYGQHEDNDVIFSKEVKPLISELFGGVSSTVIALGARGSGKTNTIQGSEDNLGLGMLAMDEILRSVEGRYAVAVSIYEVVHNKHVYDLLDTNCKEVHILEDATQGKITQKGLSKVHIKSMVDFQKLYFGDSSRKKPTQELPRRSHKALMIHILASDEGEKAKCVGRFNFLDLAGYDTNPVEGIRVNMSLNALLNVLIAINSSESLVPFRESKLARMVQDDVGGTNNVSMLVCLNPLFCQDTILATALASRLRKQTNPMSCSGKKTSNYGVSTTKKQTNPRNQPFKYDVPLSTPKKQTNPLYQASRSWVPFSANKPNPGVSTTKKQTNSQFPLFAKRTNAVQKGRQLFGGVEQEKGIKEQALSMENNESSMLKSDGNITDLPSILKSQISGGDFTVEPPYEKEMFEGHQSPPLSIQLQRVRDKLQEMFVRDQLLETIPDESVPKAPHIMESPTVEDCLQQQQQKHMQKTIFSQRGRVGTHKGYQNGNS